MQDLFKSEQVFFLNCLWFVFVSSMLIKINIPIKLACCELIFRLFCYTEFFATFVCMSVTRWFFFRFDYILRHNRKRKQKINKQNFKVFGEYFGRLLMLLNVERWRQFIVYLEYH